MGVLEELAAVGAGVVDTVAPAVVRIGRGGGRGAGVVVRDGVVVTNAHNLRGTETTVTFADGRTETGRAAGVDVDGDLAVLSVDTSGVTPLERAPELPRTGAGVFAVTAGGGGEAHVSFGVVSSLGQAFRGPRGRRIAGGLEHTAPLPRGSSGSPVVDGAGRLVGLNTNRLGDGFYLALPAGDDLDGRIDALARGEAPVRRHLGVALAPPRAARQLRRAVGLPERDGLLVRQVEDDSPAARAGLQEGDLLVASGDRALAGLDDLWAALDGVDVDGSLPLTVVRGVEELQVTVAFAG
ncbi:MAG TPA: S1C family serine protease [Acidimicrobiales bacterium]|nr:S1C family serine protease [Acidimicrobiales bacterium]